MKKRSFLALLLSMSMVAGLAACGSNEKPAETKAAETEAATTAAEGETEAGTTAAEGETEGTETEAATVGEQAPADTLVVGYSNFSEKFSPFFATSAYDQDVASMVSLGLISTDRTGAPVLNGIEGEDIDYNGTTYHYDGIADTTITQNDDGTVDYNFKLKEGVKFSDGEELTADDVIFSMYVVLDPTYDGSTTLSAQPIEGLDAYLSGMTALSDLILEAGVDGQSEYATEEQTKQYWDAFNAAGEAFAQEIVDYCTEGYGAGSVAEAASMWGFDGLADDATAADFFAMICENYGYSVADMEAETAGSSLADLINENLGDAADSFAAGVQTGESAASISGITKVSDYELNVKMTSFDATAIYQLAVTVAPMHYYGDAAQYDYDNNQFGFTKGDLSTVKAKTTKPLGAGPYAFEKYEDGIVYFTANENYFKGAPIIKNVRFQETSDADKLTGVATGTFDISDPSLSSTTADGIKSYNSNGEMTGDTITTSTVDNLGYGYIGIDASVVNVGGEPGSDASKNLRKGFATLFSVYRDTVIASYFGERASVIQYPISNTSWAAPQPADEGYEVAYSNDVDGNPIYTDSMTEDEKYAAAMDAAVGFFKAAGYTYDDATGKFTAAPEGASLSYEFMIPADGSGDHPAFGIITAVSTALEEKGITLQINDLSDSSALWDALDAQTCAMWAAAWGATVDPDMYQIYHSSNRVGLEGSTGSNHYSIADDELDSLIMEARSSADQSFRKATYKQCLDIILDWADEIPTYQRQNCVIFNTKRVNLDTLTPDITTFWTWMNDLEKLELN